jgi:TonB family protein
LSEYHPVLQRRREREANKRFMRMLAVSALAHFLLLTSTAAMSFHKPESSLRQNAIRVKLRAPMPETSSAKKSKPRSVPKSPESPSQTAKAKGASKLKKISSSNKKVSSTEDDKPGVPVTTDSDRRLMESALQDIRESLSSESEAEEDAEWDQAFQEITSNLQVRSYYEQARAIYLDAWAYPPSVLDENYSGCRMIIYVLQDGTVRGYKMFRSSGNPVLDQSVVRAVKKVRSLPPLPWLVADPPFALRFEFKPEKE